MTVELFLEVLVLMACWHVVFWLTMRSAKRPLEASLAELARDLQKCRYGLETLARDFHEDRVARTALRQPVEPDDFASDAAE